MRAILAWVLLLALTPLCSHAQSANETSPLIVESLQCEGNRSLSCRSILGYVYLRVGDRLNEEEIQNAKLRLSWLHHFDSVEIYLAKGSAKGKVRVIIKVSEAQPIATHVAVGTQSRLGSVGQAFAGQLTDPDLFGTGKTLSLQVSGLTPLTGPTQKFDFESLQYTDPHLFDSTRYFLSTSVSHLDDHYERENGDHYDANVSGAQLTVGRRLWDFSYFTAGYVYRPTIDVVYRYRQNNGEFTTQTVTARGALLLGFGWTSDDPLFPVQGSILQVNIARNFGAPSVLGAYYLKTWPVGASGFLSITVGQTQTLTALTGIGAVYAHRLSNLESFGEVRGARWYVEPTLGSAGYNADGSRILEIGLRAGLRLDTKRFGIVDFYAFGSTAWQPGNSR